MTRLIVCENCGKPLAKHCRRHYDPCCPGYCKSGGQIWKDKSSAGDNQ